MDASRESILLANRKGIGPAADCMECLYEEFFLTSWANGDPALLEWYSDDPSNAHHSCMNDPIVFRTFHAGPKETHVFHLHAHQWFAGNDPNRKAYLDSQTVGPQQSFSYNIYHGGMRGLNGDGDGWWDTQGSGNRNRTVGDSIFHCHLYPHFAQGMWAPWRVHDVLEDGTRKLPDGQEDPGLSLSFKPAEAHKRLGSVDRVTGAWLEPDAASGAGQGTPIPALIPLPGEPLPLLPTYSADTSIGMPGYPFYVPAEPGHRPPQAPLDIARAGPAAHGRRGRRAGCKWRLAGRWPVAAHREGRHRARTGLSAVCGHRGDAGGPGDDPGGERGRAAGQARGSGPATGRQGAGPGRHERASGVGADRAAVESWDGPWTRSDGVSLQRSRDSATLVRRPDPVAGRGRGATRQDRLHA